MSFEMLVMGGAVMYSCPQKWEKGDGNGADDNCVMTGEGWGNRMRG